MKVEFNISEKFRIPFLVLNAEERSAELNAFAKTLEEFSDNWQVIGFKNKRQFKLPLTQIISFRTENKGVICLTENKQIYQIQKRIYQLVQSLPKSIFVQISSGEIVNIHAIESVKLTGTGIFQILLNNGIVTYSSRRYMRNLKEVFEK